MNWNSPVRAPVVPRVVPSSVAEPTAIPVFFVSSTRKKVIESEFAKLVLGDEALRLT